MAQENSFREHYSKTNPTLKYKYDATKQVHDYSGNWDFDGDNLTDSIFFTGNYGTHLYFSLSIILSADHRKFNFPFLVTDMPLPGSFDSLNKSTYTYTLLNKFIVYDFDHDGKPDIYLYTDTSFASIPANWKKRGVTTSPIILYYRHKNFLLQSFRKRK